MADHPLGSQHNGLDVPVSNVGVAKETHDQWKSTNRPLPVYNPQADIPGGTK